MTQEELKKLRDLPIEEVAKRLGMEVIRHKSLCPFHADKHPSLSFDVAHNKYRCFVCEAKGGPIDLAMHVLNKTFRETCQWLADTGNVIIQQSNIQSSPSWGDKKGATFDPSRYERFFLHPWLSEAARKFLFEERKLSPKVIKWCRLTSWRDKDSVEWLQIPYYDADGKLIGLQNRRLTPSSQGGQGESPLPRFKYPYGSHCSIYNLPILRHLKPHDECWIAEGSSDTWSHLSHKHMAIAIGSATLLQPKDKELLVKVSKELQIRWRMAPDQDEPGRKLAAQLKEILPDLEIVDLPPDCKDYSEYYLKTITS